MRIFLLLLLSVNVYAAPTLRITCEDNPNSSPANGFRLFQYSESNYPAHVLLGDRPSCDFTHEMPSNLESISFAVRSYNSAGSSDLSEIVTYTRITENEPGRPLNLKIQVIQ